jgi:hypothetical protein
MKEDDTDTRMREGTTDRALTMQALLAEYNVIRQAIAYRLEAQRRSLFFAVTIIGAIISVTIHEGNLFMLVAIPFVLPFAYFNHREHSASMHSLKSYLRESLTNQIADLANTDGIMRYDRLLHDKESKELREGNPGVLHFHQYQVAIAFWGAPIVALFLSLCGLDWNLPTGELIGFLALWVVALAVTLCQIMHLLPFYMRLRRASERRL